MRVIKARRGSDRANRRLAEAMTEHDADTPGAPGSAAARPAEPMLTDPTRAERAPSHD